MSDSTNDYSYFPQASEENSALTQEERTTNADLLTVEEEEAAACDDDTNETNSKTTTPDTDSTDVDEPDEKPITVANVEDELRVFFHAVGYDDLVKLLEARETILGDAELKAQIDTAGSYENLLAQAINDYSAEAYRVLTAINAIENKSLFDSKLIRNGKTVLTSFLTPKRPSGNGKLVTGREARIEFAIRAGEAARLPLLNSGFTLDLEAVTPADLNIFFNRAHDEINKYGRQFGANFFFFNDLLIKEAVIDLILGQVLNSSLNNWNKPNILLRNIKLNDLKVILNALAALMHQDGFNFTHICPNPSGECTHKEETLIDITKLFRHDYSKMSDFNIEQIMERNVTHEKVQAYQDALLCTKSNFRIGKFGFELKNPSLFEYLEFGRKFNADLTKGTFGDVTIDPHQALVYSLYKIYTPYIQSLSIYDRDGNVDVVTQDLDTIAHRLSVLQKDDRDGEFIKKMDAYIASSEITHICYPAVACPECNYLPTAGGGYYTVDPESSFFTESLKKLTQR